MKISFFIMLASLLLFSGCDGAEQPPVASEESSVSSSAASSEADSSPASTPEPEEESSAAERPEPEPQPAASSASAEESEEAASESQEDRQPSDQDLISQVAARYISAIRDGDPDLCSSLFSPDSEGDYSYLKDQALFIQDVVTKNISVHLGGADSATAVAEIDILPAAGPENTHYPHPHNIEHHTLHMTKIGGRWYIATVASIDTDKMRVRNEAYAPVERLHAYLVNNLNPDHEGGYYVETTKEMEQIDGYYQPGEYRIVIWVKDRQAVEALLNAYDGPEVAVHYQQAAYSVTELLAMGKELEKEPIIQQYTNGPGLDFENNKVSIQVDDPANEEIVRDFAARYKDGNAISLRIGAETVHPNY